MIIITVPKTAHLPYDTVPFTVKEVIYKSVDGKYVLPIDAITGETIQPKIKHEGINFNLWKYRNWDDEWEMIR